jgi:D-alanyl-D-alanine carboxypeptidase/D-alanyl-D-alanine-endopeptidase (penicillin-binding protein 4)
MVRTVLIIILLSACLNAASQQEAIEAMLADSSMLNGSAALLIVDPENGDTIADYNSTMSLTPASVMKLVTTAAALEKLGPDYRFKTITGYSGTLTRNSKILWGDIVIKGGGDPTLGSERFSEHYKDFIEKWVNAISATGISRIRGRIIADDSYYDYQPVPPGWNWEDLGNYYGSGAYGISVYDNTMKLHFRTGNDGTIPEFLYMEPEEASGTMLASYLKAHGTSDMGYVYLAPYSSSGWISGTIPVNRDDFILKGSISDPPLMLAKVLTKMLEAKGIRVDFPPTTTRLNDSYSIKEFTEIISTESPSLSDIIEVLNHESVNLYAEHLVREIGKVNSGEGSNRAGTRAIIDFLDSIGIDTHGMFIGDGSGLSPQDAVNPGGMVKLLIYMKKRSGMCNEFFRSLPEAGKEGTLKEFFRDPLFENRLWAKSGTLTRTKAYSGYFTTLSGREMAFCFIVNNFTGPSTGIIHHVENLISETILHK